MNSASNNNSLVDYETRNRLRYVLDGLIKPIQYEIQLSKQKFFEDNETKFNNFNIASSNSRNHSNLSLTDTRSELLEKRAKLRGAYVEWDQGISSLKQLAKIDENNIKLLFSLLIEKLQLNNSILRLLTVEIIDVLFDRSKLFRSLLLEKFHEFLSLTIGIGENNRKIALPKPLDISEKLKLYTINCVEQWHNKYEQFYKMLNLGYNYMKNTLKVSFPQLQKQAKVMEENRKKQIQANQNVIQVRFYRLTSEFSEYEKEINTVIAEMDNILEILLPPEHEWSEYIEREFHHKKIVNAEQDKSNFNQLLSKNLNDNEPTENTNNNTQTTSNTEPSQLEIELFGIDNTEWEEDVINDVNNTNNNMNATLYDMNGENPPIEYPEYTRSISNVFDDDLVASELHSDISPELNENSSDRSNMGVTSHQARVQSNHHKGLGLGSASFQNYSVDISFNLGEFEFENDENTVIFEVLRDSAQLLQRSYLPIVQEWEDTLNKVKFDNSINSSTADVKSSIDKAQDAAIELRHKLTLKEQYKQKSNELRKKIEEKLQKCVNLNIKLRSHIQLNTVTFIDNNDSKAKSSTKSSNHIHHLNQQNISNTMQNNHRSDSTIDPLIEARKVAMKRMKLFSKNIAVRKAKAIKVRQSNTNIDPSSNKRQKKGPTNTHITLNDNI